MSRWRSARASADGSFHGDDGDHRHGRSPPAVPHHPYTHAPYHQSTVECHRVRTVVAAILPTLVRRALISGVTLPVFHIAPLPAFPGFRDRIQDSRQPHSSTPPVARTAERFLQAKPERSQSLNTATRVEWGLDALVRRHRRRVPEVPAEACEVLPDSQFRPDLSPGPDPSGARVPDAAPVSRQYSWLTEMVREQPSPGCASGISTARAHETAGRRSRRQLETACRPRRRSPGPHPPLPLVAGLQSSGGICLVYTRGNPKTPAASLQPCNPAKRRRAGCTSKGRISFD